MPSLWVDLLRLHGHLNDPQGLRWLAPSPSAEPCAEPDAEEATLTLAMRVIHAFRWKERRVASLLDRCAANTWRASDRRYK